MSFHAGPELLGIECLKGLKMTRRIKIAAFMVVVLFIAACKETVHSDLTERETNEIISVLYSKGISASKEPMKKGLYSISVAQPDFGLALSILTKAGLPRATFDTIGDVFPADSVVGTAFEERARFSFALSQELARTLTEVEGIQFARVHVVIPEKGRFADKTPPAKAALAIYHKLDFDKSIHLPQIKRLVAFSVPHLSYDDVSVSLFRAGAISDATFFKVTPNGSAVAGTANYAAGFVNIKNDLVSLLLISLALLACLFAVVRILAGLWSLITRGAMNAR
jgi:type III secretion system YscJ/HrcJ family lipoprotein